MQDKKLPFTKEQIETIIKDYPTPFHIYDEEGILENMRQFLAAFRNTLPLKLRQTLTSCEFYKN